MVIFGNPYVYPMKASLSFAHLFNTSLLLVRENLYEYDAGSGDYDSPYRFNAKELDPETGNYYYGARYYDPKISVWLSVDPLAHNYPSLSSFLFTVNILVMPIVLDGRETRKKLENHGH